MECVARLALFGSLLAISPLMAGMPPSPTVDYTRVDLNPDRVGFWLGPIGARALKHHGNPESGFEAQMQVTIVEEGSPSDGILLPGDVILAVDGKTFGHQDPRRPICNAIIEVENEGGELPLEIWRPAKKDPVGDLRSTRHPRQKLEPAANPLPGKKFTARIPLKALGRYSETSPVNCERSKIIIENGIRFIKQEKSMGSVKINYFALMATGKPEDIAFCKERMMKAEMHIPTENIHHSMMEAGKPSWGLGYTVAVMAEYTMLTGDQTFMPALRTEAKRVALAQDDNGLWYHNLFMPYLARGKTDGRVIGYGPMNAAGLGCLQGIILARKAGVDDMVVDRAIERGTAFFRQFVNNGRISYGFSGPIPGEASNGKNSIAAVIYGIHGDYEAMRYFSKCSLVVRERAGGHCGGYLNQLWGGLGASIGSPEGAQNYFLTRRWYETSVRGWDGSFRYQFWDGTSYGEGTYGANTGAYLLSYLSPTRSINILGKSVPSTEYLKEEEVGEALHAARFYMDKEDGFEGMEAIVGDDLPTEEVYKMLGSWATSLQEKAGYILLDREPEDVAERINAILAGDDNRAKLGAAYYLIKLRKGHKRTPREVQEKRNLLADDMQEAAIAAMFSVEDPYLIDMLAGGIKTLEPEHVERLLARMEEADGKNDSLHNLMFRSTTASHHSKEHPFDLMKEKGLDPEIAVRAARLGAIANAPSFILAPVTRHLKPEEVALLLEPLMRNAEFDTHIYSTEYLRKHKVEEALEMVSDAILTKRINKMWNPLDAAKSYGGHLRGILPQLREQLYRADPRDARTKKMLEEIIQIIESDQNPPPMTSIRSLLSADIAKRLERFSGKKRDQVIRQTLAELPATDQIYHALLLREYVKSDPEAAFDFVLAALGPGENYRERGAIEAGATGYPPTRWGKVLADPKVTDHQKAGMLRILHEGKSDLAESVLVKYLDSDEIALKNTAVRILGEIGGRAAADALLDNLITAERTETPALEKAISSIHKREKLGEDYFKKLSVQLSESLVNDTVKPELLHKENIHASDLPGAAGLRLLGEYGNPDLFEPFMEGKHPFRNLVGRLRISSLPLELDPKGELVATPFEKYAVVDLISTLLPAMELGSIDKRFHRPLSKMLIEKNKTDRRGLGDYEPFYIARLEALMK